MKSAQGAEYDQDEFTNAITNVLEPMVYASVMIILSYHNRWYLTESCLSYSPIQVFDMMITLISFGRFLFECLLFMLKSDSSLMCVH